MLDKDNKKREIIENDYQKSRHHRSLSLEITMAINNHHYCNALVIHHESVIIFIATPVVITVITVVAIRGRGEAREARPQ